MISRLHERDCGYARGERTASLESSVEGTPAARSIELRRNDLPGPAVHVRSRLFKNPSSGAFDEAQASSCETTVVAECNVGSFHGGHPRKDAGSSLRRPGAGWTDQAPPLR